MPKSTKKRDSSKDRTINNTVSSTTMTRQKCGPGEGCPANKDGRRPSSHAKNSPSSGSYNDSTMSRIMTGNDVSGSTHGSRRGSTSKVPSGAYMDEDSEFDMSQTRKPQRYVPKPYNFRLPPGAEKYNTPTTRCAVKNPPFIYLLDHTLAVLWCLFSKEELENPLGIVQLQWALSFIRGIFNSKGQHPRDVTVCIDAIQDILIEQYAGMANAFPPHKSKGHCGAYDCAGRGSKKRSKSKDSSKSGDSVRSKSSKSSKSSLDETSYAKLPNRLEPTVYKDVPFSINYAEMIAHTPNRLDRSDPGVEQIYIRPQDITSNTDRSSKFNTLPSDDGLSPTKSRDFLQTIRKEQIDKIQAELKTLHLIEDFIAHSDKTPEEFMTECSAMSTPKKSPASSKKSKIPKKNS